MTFSLAARDPATGMFGIAIATSAVAVGNRCPWVRAGVGAVTTQHRTDTRAGPIGLDLLSKGFSAQETVSLLAASNDFPQERQFAQFSNLHHPNTGGVRCSHAGRPPTCIGNLLRRLPIGRRSGTWLGTRRKHRSAVPIRTEAFRCCRASKDSQRAAKRRTMVC